MAQFPPPIPGGGEWLSSPRVAQFAAATWVAPGRPLHLVPLSYDAEKRHAEGAGLLFDLTSVRFMVSSIG